MKSMANKLILCKSYFNGVDKSIIEHIIKMNKVAGQLEAVGAFVTEEDQVAMLLRSLPDS